MGASNSQPRQVVEIEAVQLDQAQSESATDCIRCTTATEKSKAPELCPRE